MKLEIKNISNSLNKAYLAQSPFIDDINNFKENFTKLLNSIKPVDNEETLKDYLSDFLKNTYYKDKFATKENFHNIDLVILNGKNIDDKIGVIFETKAIKSPEMITPNELNKKAFQELIQYYLEERIVNDNIEIKHLIITNSIDWFIFNASEFERLFYQNSSFLKKYNDWRNQKLVSKNKDWFYSTLAKQFIDSEEENIVCTYFNLNDYSDTLLTTALPENETKLIELYKIFSPEHLLKLPFQNDSNNLNREFYNELLHILGLYETKDSARKIERLKIQDRNEGSLFENILSIIQSDDILQNIDQPEQFGDTKEEQEFSIVLELCITWLNRILFLKLLESQLIKYAKSSELSKTSNIWKDYMFLNIDKIKDFEDLKELFFEILAVKPDERKSSLQNKYKNIPYLNSSLFELTSLEKEAVKINHLKQHSTLPILNSTVLKDEQGKRKTGSLPFLQYLFEFLDSYNFASDNKLEIQLQNKTIINSSVLGLIFEKINGYKEGSFFTPGYITMYICRETIRSSVIQKFNSTFNWNCTTIAKLYNEIGKIELEKANETFNSIRICDPAVGSGHFLVSALNELLSIKSELGILTDSEGQILRNTYCEVQNDELFINHFGQFFVYNFKDKESQRIQETIFKEKRTIIENCLFGVDINPKSVHICRLRLWIELLKNAYYTKETNFKELETLPNIDINIKCGNSLISHFSTNGNRNLTQSLKTFTIKYKEVVAEYKNTTDRNVKRSLVQFIKEQKEHFAQTVDPHDEDIKLLRKVESEIGTMPMIFNRDDQVQWQIKLTRLNKEKEALEKIIKENQKNIYYNAFEWRYEFPELLDDNGFFVGFDAIIGNPPYIEFKNLENKYKSYIENKYKTATGKYDIYIPFYEMSFSILQTNGIIGFITPTRYAVRDYGKALRDLIRKNYTLQQFIDFSDIQLFSEATNYTGIFILKKANNKDYYFDYLKQTVQNSLLKPTFEKLNCTVLNQDKWNFKGTEIDTIITKLKANATQLKELVTGINQGIATGKDEVFIVSDKDENFLNFETKYLKPFLKGKDVAKYKTNWSNHYVIYPYDNLGKVINETDFKKQAPNIYEYLIQNKELLIGRTYFDKSNKIWYELWNQRKPSTFEKTKIITLDNASHNSFTLDKKNYYGTTTVYSFTLKDNRITDLYLLGILNSKLLDFFHKQNSIPQANGFYRYQTSLIENMPIKIADKKTQNKIEQLVVKSLKYSDENKDISLLENQINQLVYEIYGIDNDEIQIIEKEQIK